MAHLHRWALAFLGSGLGGSSVSAAESAPHQPVRLTDRLASLQGPSEPASRFTRRQNNRGGCVPVWLLIILDLIAAIVIGGIVVLVLEHLGVHLT